MFYFPELVAKKCLLVGLELQYCVRELSILLSNKATCVVFVYL